jgi:hypothetical protein
LRGKINRMLWAQDEMTVFSRRRRRRGDDDLVDAPSPRQSAVRHLGD